ncbi:MAG TPA: pitrilysin family protein [Candidatus Sulfotelmatobacter sp.]|nr:pitrilysin family protein [Candidatus Sulfotelmatobacter sp.]
MSVQTITSAVAQSKVVRGCFALLLLISFAVAQKEVPLPKDLPPYGPEKPLATPSVNDATLDNGLTLWLVSEPGFPKVALTVAVRGGLAADPGARPGLSELLSKTLDQGTRTRNAKKIAQELQAAGGDLNTSASKDSLELSSVVLSSKVDNAITVLADILQNASFPDAEVTLAKRNLADELDQREAEPSFLAARARDNVLFSDHPYHVTFPTRDSIAATTSADLREIFAQRFRPDQVILIATGDFQSDKIMAALKAALGSWKAAANPAVAPVSSPSAQIEHAVYIVPRPGSVQTTIELATMGPKLGDPDYELTQVANAIYGGTFGSRLTSNIREDKGYTYTPFARLASYQKAAEMISHADVRNEVTAPTLNEMEYELNRMATTTPTDEELSKAKRFLVGLEALRLQDRASLARRLATLWIAGLQPDQIGISGQKVSATTAADVDAVAKKYFPAHRSAIIAVGEEKVIREALSPFGLHVHTLQ